MQQFRALSFFTMTRSTARFERHPQFTMIQPFQTVSINSDLEKYSAIIDVRSPSEHAQDHIPGAINLPVLNDQERIDIGTLYRENSYRARLKGAALVSRNIAHHIESRLVSEKTDFMPLIYCWRGGLRSHSMATVMKSIGWHVHLLEGGYRSFRKRVSLELQSLLTPSPFHLKVLEGVTGVGKTKLLKTLAQIGAQTIDLEGLANHRGSLLGEPHLGEQPSQKYFESQLWYQLKKLDPKRPVYIEAESNRIGNLHLPSAFWCSLAHAEVIHIDMPIEQRIALTKADYHHFLENPSALIERLQVLRKIRGHKQIEHWESLIQAELWDEFLYSILTQHYDLAYRGAGEDKSKYPAPSYQFTIPENKKTQYLRIAKDITELHS